MASGAELKSESLLELMKEHLKTDAGKEITKKIGLVYQINIAPKKIGFNEVIFTVDLKKGEVKKGAYEGGKPDATFSFKDDDFVKVALGKMNPQIAFMRGAMKIKGSLSAATKFTPDIFPKPSKIQLHEITKGTMNFIISFCFCLCISLLPSFGTPAMSLNMIQGFNWHSSKKGGWYNSLKTSILELADSGITHVCLSLSLYNRTYLLNLDCTFWQDNNSLLLLKHFRILPGRLYDLDASSYGNKDELKSLFTAMHEKGIKAVADIVINHRAAVKQDENGPWRIFEGGKPDGRLDFDASLICRDDNDHPFGTGNPDTGDNFPFTADMDHTNPSFKARFDGWRFDYAIGYGSSLTNLYMDRTLPAFAVAEYWRWNISKGQDGKLDQNQDLDSGSGGVVTTFDMTTKYFMDVAVEGLIGMKPESAVTFIDNHDTWSQNYCLSHLIKSCLDMLTLSPILAPQAYSMITSLSGGGRRTLYAI
ncbi:unnamed protein product [Malus baccata var. baccata]